MDDDYVVEVVDHSHSQQLVKDDVPATYLFSVVAPFQVSHYPFEVGAEDPYMHHDFDVKVQAAYAS
jgi:hypothetical protein